MVDDERDDTVQDKRREDEGSAPTLMVTPTPLPPAPSGISGALTRPFALRVKRDTQEPAPLADNSRYVIGELLGQGGMGDVLLAYDEHIGREVAVKRIRSTEPTADQLARFLREARVQGRLEHPAVVPVHDLAIDDEGKPFFVMKRLSGTDMAQLLDQLRAGDGDEAGLRRKLLRAFVDVCLAVELAHSRGVIHRDLKPANIMLGDFGEVYVLDWGVARTTDTEATGPAPSVSTRDLALDSGEQTQAGTILGTPAYMAPEQLLGDTIGPAADIYALGCILYEIAAGEALHARGRAPGQAFTPVDARPSRRRSDCAPELDVICERAIRIAADERYGSARMLGDAVQAYLDGDRDIAVRKELAQHHIAQAREALARSDDELERRAAMRAAGRALALDPTASEAADLVTHLMLRPPKEVPEEVERKLAEIDVETARSQGRLGALAMMGYLAFIPLLLWTGVHDLTLLAVFGLLATCSGVQLVLLTRGLRISKRIVRGIYLNAVINAALIGIVCRMVGPFIIAPTLVLTTLMAYASHPRFGKIRVLGPILTAAVAVPWLLELAGVIDPTYEFKGGALVLRSQVVTFSSLPTQLGFALLLLSLIGVVAVLSRALAKRQREATRSLEVQAWQLRQLVPTVGSRTLDG